MGVFQAGLLIPVAVAPVIGGALAGTLGWRSIFWCLAIYSGVFLVFLVLLLPETLRSVVGNGSRVPRSLLGRYPLRFYQARTRTKWVRQNESGNEEKRKSVDLMGPLRILFSKQAAPMMVYTAVYYTVWQMAITAMSTLFEEKYGLNDTQIGLTFIGNGVGSIIGTLVTGKMLNVDYRRVMGQWNAEKERSSSASDPEIDTSKSDTTTDEKVAGSSPGPSDPRECTTNPPPISSSSYPNDACTGPEETSTNPTTQKKTPTATFPLEKARLSRLPYISLLQSLSILLFGWSLNYSSHIHISVPIISTFITGWTAVSTLSIATTYLVDIFHEKSAAAGASLNLVRCLLAAGGASFVMPLITKIGVGWAFTAFVGLQGVAVGGLFVQMRCGGRWRGNKVGLS